MTFNSVIFFVFIAVFLPVFFAIRPWPLKKIWLLIGGLVFYGWFNPWYLGLVFTSTTIDFLCVRVMTSRDDQRGRKLALTMSIVSNLTILATFKYFNFFVANVASALNGLGLEASLPALSLILPIGISFYSFEAISYAVDVYQRKTTVARSYLDLLLFITFFPHLVAGPIVRARDFLPQLEIARRVTSADVFTGLQWIVVGYFMKVGVADNLSSSVDRIFAASKTASTTEAWLGTVYFAFQIFCDFAGYTAIARGLAKIMGFDLSINFNFPYIARGFSDFWRRWHISLSSWLRDYLYIPLGGNRGGTAKTYRNLMLTMVLGGLWHGAAWTFVAWGALHGAYLALEHAMRGVTVPTSGRSGVLFDLLRIALTFVLVLIAWVFFRAATMGEALELLEAMFSPTVWKFTMPPKSMIADGFWIVPMVFYFAYAYVAERGLRINTPPLVRAIALGVLAFVTLICRDVSDAFIYFQF